MSEVLLGFIPDTLSVPLGQILPSLTQDAYQSYYFG